MDQGREPNPNGTIPHSHGTPSLLPELMVPPTPFANTRSVRPPSNEAPASIQPVDEKTVAQIRKLREEKRAQLERIQSPGRALPPHDSVRLTSTAF